eukprot:9790425-Alexandrium_andersonii.AAC.1
MDVAAPVLDLVQKVLPAQSAPEHVENVDKLWGRDDLLVGPASCARRGSYASPTCRVATNTELRSRSPSRSSLTR